MLWTLELTGYVPLSTSSQNYVQQHPPSLPQEYQDLADMKCKVLVPLLRSADQARELVQAAKFPPWGKRGFGSPIAPERFNPVPSFTEYLQQANDAILTMVQIETQEALNEVEDIAAVKGIDVLFVGPFDLGMMLLSFNSFQMTLHRTPMYFNAGPECSGKTKRPTSLKYCENRKQYWPARPQRCHFTRTQRSHCQNPRSMSQSRQEMWYIRHERRAGQANCRSGL